MTDSPLLQHSDVILKPDASRTVIRPFELSYPSRFRGSGPSRVAKIVDRVLTLEGEALDFELGQVMESLDTRHRDVEEMMHRRFDQIEQEVPIPSVSERQKTLIGAYFSEEYSFEAAALFNPSAILATDQDGAPQGGVRFVMSLRGIGEGHVSSVTFRSGTWVPGGELKVDRASQTAVPPVVDDGHDGSDGSVKLLCGGSRDISETVLFPILPSQHQGIEDVRLVRFTEDNGDVTVRGTYTAFSGSVARSEMMTGVDFRTVTMRPLTGDAADAKGMALFPRRVDGKYVMLGRQDNESIWLHTSDDLYRWEGGSKLVSPRYPWEYVQMGNCGSPIEIDEGWLVLTHGVGTVRNYCMGACLLDKNDPSKVLARTEHPILKPSIDERDGYVPNVVYSCGSIIHDRQLLVPYGVADSFTAFATTSLDALLGQMG